MATLIPDDVRADATRLEQDLAAALRAEVRFDAGSRATYATDASNFRQVPIGVVVPASVEDGARAVQVCHEHGVPVVSRGGGTSLAGQCCNVAVVIDWSKHCDALVSVDAEAATCLVEPGIVLDVLNAQLAPYGLEYGPQPATHYNCTLGGMIGNNSCGATAQRAGKVVDNIARLEVLLHDGTRFWCGPTTDADLDRIIAEGGRRGEVYRGLRELRDTYLAQIRTGYPQIPRRVSGYNLDSLLPENGFDVARALVGSESTLVTVLRAELTLVPTVARRSLVVLGYPSIDAAADAVPTVVGHGPIALEGIDDRLVDFEKDKHMNPEALRLLPEGAGWLLVQFGGATREAADAAAQRLVDALADTDGGPSSEVFHDPYREKELWLVRESGLGATAHVPGEAETYPGWEDAAVAPHVLGDYLRDLRALYEEFGYQQASVYGHFGQGCVHSRIPFDLRHPDGVAAYREFLERAADLVVGYGGSLSGEHGDGQQRGELLTRMFSPDLITAFGRMKAIFDPDGLMNPGKVVHPNPLDADLRMGPDWRPRRTEGLHFAFEKDGGSFIGAASRCVGVGKCRQHTSGSGTVMCPSFQVLHEEEHSTRGRSRLLFEMLDGHRDGPIRDAWRSEEVHDALDLCLSCKGCKQDCPVDVDMATYKAEFLSHYYEGRLRPRSHYAMGFLPVAAQLIGRMRLGPLVNALTHTPLLHRAAVALAGVEDRELPLFAGETLQHWMSRREPRGTGERGAVLLWPDTFTNHLHPHVGRAAVELLEDAGWRVRVPEEPVCCGLTWISTGQLDVAQKVLGRTVRLLTGHVRAGGLVLGLEPSCTAVFRSDLTELFPHDEDARALADHTVTLAELLRHHTPGWSPPRRDGQHAIIQVHCHQHAVLGFEEDQALLREAGVDAERLDSGCCGLAGNFGFEPGHLEVSRACAERVLLPAVREADERTAVLADGFSCRTQVHELAGNGREAVHLAELLRGRPSLDAGADRPREPNGVERAAVLAGAGIASAALLALAGTAARRAVGRVLR